MVRNMYHIGTLTCHKFLHRYCTHSTRAHVSSLRSLARKRTAFHAYSERQGHQYTNMTALNRSMCDCPHSDCDPSTGPNSAPSSGPAPAYTSTIPTTGDAVVEVTEDTFDEHVGQSRCVAGWLYWDSFPRQLTRRSKTSHAHVDHVDVQWLIVDKNRLALLNSRRRHGVSGLVHLDGQADLVSGLSLHDVGFGLSGRS